MFNSIPGKLSVQITSAQTKHAFVYCNEQMNLRKIDLKSLV